MSLSTIVVTAENDLVAFANAVSIKNNAISKVISALAGGAVLTDAKKIMADAMNDAIAVAGAASKAVPAAIAAGQAAVTAASTGNISGALFIVGGVATQLEGDVTAVFHFLKGLGENTAPAGADASEQAGVTVNQDAHSFFDAIYDAFTGNTPAAPANSGGAVGG